MTPAWKNKRKVDTEKVSTFFRFNEVFIYLCQQLQQKPQQQNKIRILRMTPAWKNKRKVDTEKVSTFFRFNEVFIYLCQQLM